MRRPSTTRLEDLVDDGDKSAQETRSIRGIVSEAHLGVRNRATQGPRYYAGSLKTPHAFRHQRDTAPCGHQAERRMKSGGLLHDRRVHAGPAADRNEGVVVSRRMTPREQNKALAAEGAQHQRATSRKWMTFRKDDHEPFADDRFHRQPAVGRRQPQKAGMDLSLMEHSKLFAGPHHLKRDIDVRVTPAEH